jgi:hypothetical protein
LFSAPLVLLLFPDGRLPSPGWKWALGTYVALGACVQAVTAAAAITIAVRPKIQWDTSGSPVPGPSAALNIATGILSVGCLLLALGWVARRFIGYRRTKGALRQQFKWLGLGACCLLVALIVSFVTPSGTGATATVLNGITGVTGVVFPLTVGIAVLRWRLYDIDRVVSRTLSYAVVTGLLVGVYIGMVALTTEALPLSSSVGVGASTLVAAALFAPVRRRAQRLVDRRFNRVRYDADRTVEAFASRLRDVVGLSGVSALCLETVDRAMEPRSLCLWVAPGHTGHGDSAVALLGAPSPGRLP